MPTNGVVLILVVVVLAILGVYLGLRWQICSIVYGKVNPERQRLLAQVGFENKLMAATEVIVTGLRSREAPKCCGQRRFKVHIFYGKRYQGNLLVCSTCRGYERDFYTNCHDGVGW